MQVNCTKLSNTERELQVEIPAADFDKYLEKAASAMSADLEVQGFRKGHIPRYIVEQKVGSSVLYNEAAEIAVQATYEKALSRSTDYSLQTTADNQAVDSSQSSVDSRQSFIVPEVQVTKLAPGNPFVYKVILRTPVFELSQAYKDIARKVLKKEAKEIRVEEKEVDDTLKWLMRQKRNEDPSSGSQTTKVGSDTPVLEVKLDDDFAKSLGNFKDLESLKKSIREGTHLEKKKKEKERVRLEVVKAIIAKSYTEIPEKVIDQEVLKIEEEFRQNIAHLGLDFEEYLKKIKKTKEELRSGWRDQAKERVEISLVLEAIASRESIEPEEKEIGDEAQKILNRFKGVDEAKKNIDPARLRSYVRGILKNEKTFQLLESI